MQRNREEQVFSKQLIALFAECTVDDTDQRTN